MSNRLSALVLILAAGLSLGANAQTPEQRYFGWTEMESPAEVYHARRQQMMSELSQAGGGVLLVPSHHGISQGHSFRQLDDFWYLSGLELPASMLVIDADSGVVSLYAPARDARFASDARPGDFPGRPLADDPQLAALSGFQLIQPLTSLDTDIASMVASGRTLLLNGGARGTLVPPETSYFHDWSAGDGLMAHLSEKWPQAKLSNAFEAVARVRMIKSPEELATIRRVCELTVEAIQHAATFIKDGVSERDLEAELEAAYKRGGAQRLAFSSIIKSGPNSLWPWRILAAHYDRRNRSMADGELVIFDVGTELNGYVSDVGRTFPVSGHFSDRQREILEMEVGVSEAIIAAIQPGITLAELTDIAREATPPEARKYMQTGLFFGHFIGMSTGDPALYDIPLAPGMVFTVEPWYYNHDEDISVFTEDVVVVTEGGADVLTDALPRRPDDLERMVGRR